ncbi:chemotaxis protein CheW [Phormidium tenue]|jgi:positive phototaxis protein PixI|uniref:Chemotaxis protein CheW n=2 Tax=Phormidium tenue TaxID=126344 RepID=A0ABR8CAM1_9CYAN|nr:chemotaxis protein CheW [Phormidium tenue]MBD2317584.1 chemotaxis protein CheW [Phormidium tenue FACHB-1050]
MSMQTLFESVDRFPDSKIGAKLDADVNTYLKFVIDPQTIGLLESEFTQEVLTIKASHIIPVPNKPSCILGILSRRRRVYWAIDLAMLLGLQPLDQNIRLYEVILISAQELSLALVVPKIWGVVDIHSNHLEQNINSVPATLRPYFKGYINEKEEISYLLKAESIMRSTILHS